MTLPTHKLTTGLSEFPGSLVELPNQEFGQARADRLLVLTEELRTPWQHLPGSVTFARFEALSIRFKISVGNGHSSSKTVGSFWFLAHYPLLPGPNISVIIFFEGGVITTRNYGDPARTPLP